jgi:hypothetical protein
MSVSGLCQICHAAEADTRCDRCGTMVCVEHLDEPVGVCVECVAELPGGGEPTSPEDHPDVDRYQS